MVKEDLNILNRLKRDIKVHPEFQYFLANKRGGNGTGIGADRSVILARCKSNGNWIQYGKIWGDDNVNRAKEIIKQTNHKQPYANNHRREDMPN